MGAILDFSSVTYPKINPEIKQGELFWHRAILAAQNGLDSITNQKPIFMSLMSTKWSEKEGAFFKVTSPAW